MLVQNYFFWKMFLLYLGSILSTISCSGLKKVAQIWTLFSQPGELEESPLPSCYPRTRGLQPTPKPTFRALKRNWRQASGMKVQKPWISPTTECRASARNEMTNLTWLFACISYQIFFFCSFVFLVFGLNVIFWLMKS